MNRAIILTGALILTASVLPATLAPLRRVSA